MFEFFRRKRKVTLMDQVVNSVYGNSFRKTADLHAASDLAIQLLGSRFSAEEVNGVAAKLNAGPMPYSTHDLAVATALRCLKEVDPADRGHLFEAQIQARMTVLEWTKEKKVNPILAQAFEQTLYREYAPSKTPREIVKADWVGTKLAEMFDPNRVLDIVTATHQSLSDSDSPFVAVAALRLAGFRLAVRQESIVSRVEQKVLTEIAGNYLRFLVKKCPRSADREPDGFDLLLNILPLASSTSDAFMQPREERKGEELHPAWFAGKEICKFLTARSGERTNPGEIMSYAELLQDTISDTKKLFDELLEAGVEFRI